MREIRVRMMKLRFGSFVKLFFFSGLASGMAMAVLMLVAVLLGMPATANVGAAVFSGMAGAVLSVVMAPIITSILFAWFSVLMYWPFRLLMKITGGISLTLSIAEERYAPQQYSPQHPPAGQRDAMNAPGSKQPRQ